MTVTYLTKIFRIAADLAIRQKKREGVPCRLDDLAEATGIGKAYISQVLHSNRRYESMEPERFNSLCGALNLEPDTYLVKKVEARLLGGETVSIDDFLPHSSPYYVKPPKDISTSRAAYFSEIFALIAVRALAGNKRIGEQPHSQADLVRLTGYNKGQLCQMLDENNEFNLVNPEKFKKLCSALDLDPDAFLVREVEERLLRGERITYRSFIPQIQLTAYELPSEVMLIGELKGDALRYAYAVPSTEVGTFAADQGIGIWEAARQLWETAGLKGLFTVRPFSPDNTRAYEFKSS